MTPDEAVMAVIDALERGRVPYMIVGSLASNFHGIPRATADADFVVEIEPGAFQRLSVGLPPGLRLQAQGAFETVTGTLRYVVELEGSPFVCELFIVTDDRHDSERFGRRERVQILDRVASVATAEDMIVTKLRWGLHGGRSKDLEDARNIMAVRGADLNWDYILQWAAEHGTLALLEQIRQSIPPDIF